MNELGDFCQEKCRICGALRDRNALYRFHITKVDKINYNRIGLTHNEKETWFLIVNFMTQPYISRLETRFLRNSYRNLT